MTGALTRRPDGSAPADPASLWGSGLAVDSLQMLELVVGLEEAFGVLIDDAEIASAHFERVEDVVLLVRRALARRSTHARGG